MLARDDGDGAVRAATIAALGDLHISVVRGRRDTTVAPERIIVVSLT